MKCIAEDVDIENVEEFGINCEEKMFSLLLLKFGGKTIRMKDDMHL